MKIPKNSVILIGAGGHAKEVSAIAGKAGIRVLGYCEETPSQKKYLNLPIYSLGEIKNSNIKSPLHAAIGNPNLRSRLIQYFPQNIFTNIIDPQARIGDKVEIGDGSYIGLNSVLTTGIIIGKHVIINTASVISHDVKISDFVTISPSCTICGRVKIGENTFIGAGTTIIENIKIGKNCLIAAGSVVTKDIPDGAFAAGAPAVVKKR